MSEAISSVPVAIALGHCSVTLRDAIIDLLRRFGMTFIFGNPGTTKPPLFHNVTQDFRYVLGLQESAGVGIADSYAQARRDAAFAKLHAVAGVGHVMNNVFAAYKNRMSMVITACQQKQAILPFDPLLFSGQTAEQPKPYGGNIFFAT